MLKVLVLIVLAALGPATVCRAQNADDDERYERRLKEIGRYLAPGVTPRQIEYLVRVGGLSADQAAAAERLREANAAARARVVDKVREFLREAWRYDNTFPDGELDPEFQRIRSRAWCRAEAKIVRLSEEFIDEVHLLLGERFAPAVGRMAAKIRRDRHIGEWEAYWSDPARVDVVVLFHDLGLRGARFAPADERLEVWEREFDRLLSELHVITKPYDEAARERSDDARRKGDYSEWAAMASASTPVYRRMRMLTIRTAEDVASLLPEPHAQAFREAFENRAYPRVFGEVPELAALAKALKLEDLSREQRDQIEAVWSTHRAARRAANIAWRDAIEDWNQSSPDPDPVTGHTPPEPSRITELGVKRRAMDAQFGKELRAILTPAQQAAVFGPVPKRPAVPDFDD
ncbi:MAG: hypothetical protein IBJ11_05075 [Phycisphaerales bacterium]|nr:hypothetical protein [Phycisphaerales bacterium]